MSKRAGKLRHRAEFELFRAGASIGQRLSERNADRLGAQAGRAAYGLGLRRRKVHENLSHAFPDRDDDWIRTTARACYMHLGMEGLATLRMASTGGDRLHEACSAHGLENVRRALSEHGGAVVVSGHLGNWELAAATFPAFGMPVLALAQRLRNRLFNDAVLENRRRLGIDVVDRGKATRPVLRALRKGHVVFFASDQNAGRNGVFVPFFGRPASTHRGAALFALRTDTPLFFVSMIRQPADSAQRYALRLEEIEVDRSGDPEAAVLRLTQAFTAELERAVRSAPEQYFWLHRRWKTRPRERGSG